MENYKINYNGDTYVENIHHMGVELAGFSDVFWNTESIQRSLKSKRAAKVIAKAIADYTKE